eukprot:TRINITY_DN5853_c0_g1_i1.p1 TRINITY_DN5853_c0_g1~~TRINITY_DN5853_c0_g1_i1.p1  ORF type:complete len:367 (-),score=101.17 TRINITY_DN5853_c0_g1_i1:33-1133(-)
MSAQVNRFVKAVVAIFVLVILYKFFFSDFPLDSFASYSYSSSSSSGCRTATEKGNCIILFQKYVPSELESKWMKSAISWMWYYNFCTAQKSQAKEIDIWLKTCAKLNNTSNFKLPESDPDYLQASQVFSKFIYSKTCGPKTEIIEKWIEPLAFSLRDPRYNSGCTPNGAPYGYVKDYILLDAIGADRKDKRRKNVLMDFSAATFLTGPPHEGSPQQYFFDSYKARGINFTELLMWDATSRPDTEILKDVPSEWYPYYHYFNTAPSASKKDPKNPLNMLKEFATPDDFVSFKLDLNAPATENDFISLIMEDPEVSSRIDEFFFEHHVNFDHLNAFWGTVKDPNMYLPDSYKLFSKLRHLGIRAHGWI